MIQLWISVPAPLPLGQAASDNGYQFMLPAQLSEHLYGFIKQVDKGSIAIVKDLESWCFEH